MIDQDTSRGSQLLARGAVLLTCLVALLGMEGCSSKTASETDLVVVSYGGALQDAQRTAMFEPFTQSKGVRVKDVPYNGQYAKLKEMVTAERVEWGVVDVEGNMVLRGGDDGLLEPIDYTVVDRSVFIDQATHKYGVGVFTWSFVLAYPEGTLNAAQLTSPWRTYFDTKGIRGSRGMRNDPRRNLEIALLADGVAADLLYPLDVDRAFRVLTRFRDELKDAGYTIVWWEEYAKPTQLLQDGEVVLTPSGNGRVTDAQAQGARLGFTWNQALFDLDWWVVPKGARNKRLAMEFIAFASGAGPQAELARRISYGPVNRAAFAELSAEVARRLPTYPENLAKQTRFDDRWWNDNLAQVSQRWNEWRVAR